MPKKDPIEEFFIFTLLAYKLSHSYIEKILNVSLFVLICLVRPKRTVLNSIDWKGIFRKLRKVDWDKDGEALLRVYVQEKDLKGFRKQTWRCKYIITHSL